MSSVLHLHYTLVIMSPRPKSYTSNQQTEKGSYHWPPSRWSVIVSVPLLHWICILEVHTVPGSQEKKKIQVKEYLLSCVNGHFDDTWHNFTCSLSRTALACVDVRAAPSWRRGLCVFNKNSSTSCTGRTPGVHSNWSSLLSTGEKEREMVERERRRRRGKDI